MNMIQKSATGTTVIPVESLLFTEQRKVFIEGDINAQKAGDFIKQMLILNSKEDSTTIDILINSTGGDINAGFAIYDAMRLSKAPIRTYCVGSAYSMAAILFAAGGQRFMLPHSELMLHEPFMIDNPGGSYDSMCSKTAILDRTRKEIVNILVRHTEKSEDEIRQAIHYDHFFPAKEAIDFGLCDEILEELR